MLSLSTQLKNYILGGGTSGSLSGVMNSGKLLVFGGPLPASADDATPSGVLLCTVTKDGDGSTGLTFGSATGGVLSKSSSETWKCLAANITAGTAVYYRFCIGSDDGTGAGTTEYRIQGTIGTDSSHDMTVTSIGLSSGADFGPVTSFEIAVP